MSKNKKFSDDAVVARKLTLILRLRGTSLNDRLFPEGDEVI